MSPIQKKITKWLLVLALLSPIGLFLPEIFNAGDAWGEWDTEGIKKLIGYVPSGMERLSGLWNAPVPDYSFKGFDEGFKMYFAYILSAFIGIILCGFLTFFAIKTINSSRAKQE